MVYLLMSHFHDFDQPAISSRNSNATKDLAQYFGFSPATKIQVLYHSHSLELVKFPLGTLLILVLFHLALTSRLTGASVFFSLTIDPCPSFLVDPDEFLPHYLCRRELYH